MVLLIVGERGLGEGTRKAAGSCGSCFFSLLGGKYALVAEPPSRSLRHYKLATARVCRRL